MDYKKRETQRPFLSVAEFGDRIGVSTRTAYNMVNDRIVPVIRIRGVLSVPEAALETWLAECEKKALASVRSS